MILGEIFTEAMPIIEKFAPSLGAAIGGPFGHAAGSIIPWLAKAFESDPTDLKQLVANILKDPDAETKLNKIETLHGPWLKHLIDKANNLSKAEINIKLEWQNPSN